MTASALRRALPPPDHVHAGDDADSLAAIVVPSITLALWRRPPPVVVGDLAAFSGVRLTAPADEAGIALADAWTGPRAGWHDGLIADVADLARRFAAVTRTGRIELRLDRLTGDGCWRFHADYVSVRLISTYAGRGTQWLAQGAADDRSPFEMAAGDVGLFKGRLLAGDAAIVHRSPPIADTGEERLLLVIDVERPALRAEA